jgi:hypothetical protein
MIAVFLLENLLAHASEGISGKLRVRCRARPSHITQMSFTTKTHDFDRAAAVLRPKALQFSQ